MKIPNLTIENVVYLPPTLEKYYNFMSIMIFSMIKD